VHFAAKRLRYANSYAQRGGRQKRRGKERMVFLCVSNTKRSHVFIAVEGLRKNRKAAAVTATAMMEAEDQVEQQN